MSGDFFDRIDKYIKYKGLNDNKVTVQAGLPIGSLGKQRRGSRGLSVQSIAKILHVYDDLNPEWLLTGKGTMLKEEETKTLYDNLDIYTKPLTELLTKMHEEVKELSSQLFQQITENKYLRSEMEKLKTKLSTENPDKTSDRRFVHCNNPGITTEHEE